MEIKTALEQQLFNGKNFHVVIYNKTESASGLHQHDYYEFTIVLTGRYYRRSTVSAFCWNEGFCLPADGILSPELLRIWCHPHSECGRQQTFLREALSAAGAVLLCGLPVYRVKTSS